MKVVALKVVVPLETKEPEGWRGWFGQLLIEVETEDGLKGYGIGGGGEAGVHVVETVLRGLLIGADATDISGLWDRMYRATLPIGRKGIAIMAISCSGRGGGSGMGWRSWLTPRWDGPIRKRCCCFVSGLPN